MAVKKLLTWQRAVLAVAVYFLALSPASGAAIDLEQDILLRWPPGPDGRGLDVQHISLLQKAGITTVLLPWPGGRSSEEFATACRSAGLKTVAELGRVESLAIARDLAAQARRAGFSGLAFDSGGTFDDAKPVKILAAEEPDLDLLVFLKAEEIHWDIAPARAVLREGLWPGVRAPPNQDGRGEEVATASTEPWVDANSYLVAYLGGMFPDRPAVLGYRPDAEAGLGQGRAVPFETLELALTEAFVAGGNFVMSIEDDYGQALFAGDPKALAAWDSLGRTVSFLQEHAESLRRPTRGRTMLAAGTLEESGELLNLLYRRNLCPVVQPATAMPPIDPIRFRALVAANLERPGEAETKRMLDYVRAGGLLVTAPAGRSTPAWWRVPDAEKTRTDKDRDHYVLGQGRLVAYFDRILDPSEFALDVIDLVGVRTRDLRLWNAGTAVGIAAGELGAPEAFLYLINYGDPIEQEFPARIEGLFQRATFLGPADPPRELPAAKRGPSTEIAVDRLDRFALIELEQGPRLEQGPQRPAGEPASSDPARTF